MAPAHHFMHLDDGPFARISSGSKDIELRVNDDKRRKVAKGDTITFTSRSDPQRQLLVTVTDLYHAADFESLVARLPASRLGCAEMDKEALIEILNTAYSAAERQDYGVVGLGFRLDGVK